jgi:hypothetical protein
VCVRSDPPQVPAPIHVICNYLKKHSATTVGLFRVCASLPEVRAVLAEFRAVILSLSLSLSVSLSLSLFRVADVAIASLGHSLSHTHFSFTGQHLL